MSEEINNENQENEVNENNDLEAEEDEAKYYEHLPADHPHLRRFQLSLEQQLKKEEESIRLKFKEKSEDSKKLKKQREELGITLYSLQQQFAQVESAFNEMYTRCKTLDEQVKQEENRLTEELKMYNDKYQSVREQEKMVMQSLEDLNQLNSMLKYVETYNLQVQSNIKVTKTTANKVEENIVNQERKKKEQDFFIDMLETRVKNLTEKKLLFEAQLESQKEETAEATKNLAEANAEIQNILAKKRDLQKDYSKTVFNMHSKDNAKATVEKNINEQEEEKMKLRSQINRYKNLFDLELNKNGILLATINTHENNIKQTKKETNELKSKIEVLNEKRGFIEASINKTKTEIDNLGKIAQSLEFELDIINKNKVKLINEARSTHEKNLIILSNKETHTKQAENLIKANQKLKFEIEDLINEEEAKKNETIRVEIDILNIKAQNSKLDKKLKLMNEEITKLEKDYTDNINTIKQNHKNLEKKQLEMDKLNKDYGELMKNKKGEDEGKFEVEINKLQTKVKQLEDKKGELRKQWLNKKQELVNKETALNTIKESCLDKKSKEMILNRKKIRLNCNYAIQEKEIKEIQFNLKQLREYEMVKFGKLLGKNRNLNDKLKHQITDVETQFKEKLTSMENESVKIEMEIEVLRDEKADTLAQIIETERQIHLWERKIELQEQMQKIIKPDSGNQEIDVMKATIHRQKLLYKKFLGKQEEVMKNMERSVQRRDFIKVRYPVDEFGSSKVKNKDSKSKAIKELDGQIEYVCKKQREYTNNYEKEKLEYDSIQNNIKELDDENMNVNAEAFNFHNNYFKEKIKTNNYFCKTKQFQDSTKILEDYSINKYKPKSQEEISKELEDIQKENETILETLRNFKDTHPEMQIIIEEVLNINE